MFKHNLKIALRNLAKYRLQSVVGVLSVALGMVFCSLTFIWIRYERSFDAFHRDADDIYMVMRRIYQPKVIFSNPITTTPAAEPIISIEPPTPAQ